MVKAVIVFLLVMLVLARLLPALPSHNSGSASSIPLLLRHGESGVPPRTPGRIEG